MAGFILRLLIVALGLWLASELVPGIEVKGVGTLLGGGAAAWHCQRRGAAGADYPHAACHHLYARIVSAGDQCGDAGAGGVDVRQLHYRGLLGGAVRINSCEYYWVARVVFYWPARAD